jgi:hypothetical protein
LRGGALCYAARVLSISFTELLIIGMILIGPLAAVVIILTLGRRSKTPKR